MPLSKIQAEILHVLAGERDPESYVAGSTPLNRGTDRFSTDIDIFHDRQERVKVAAERDGQILAANGYSVRWLRQAPAIQSANVTRGQEGTKLEWVADSDYRFFPTVKDATFGYVLHPVDMALNKASAAAGRRELRDIVDLLAVHERILPLGAVMCAVVDKAPGFTPEGMIAEIRRNSIYPREVWEELPGTRPWDPMVIMPRLRQALDEAEEFVSKMPSDKVGLLFLKDSKVVQPDPEHLDEYQTHAGQRRGHWPSNQDIESAMLEHYNLGSQPL